MATGSVRIFGAALLCGSALADLETPYYAAYSHAETASPPPIWESCDWAWLNDGHCDRLCNFAERNFDGEDCFHNATNCYNLASGADYRGTINATKMGRPCQFWTDQFPNTHSYTTSRYPNGGLGGHNFCRNPLPDDGSTGPWCLVESLEAPMWEYCDVPKPSLAACDQSYLVEKQPMTTLPMNAWSQRFYVYEEAYHYYQVVVPPSVDSIEVVLVRVELLPRV